MCRFHALVWSIHWKISYIVSLVIAEGRRSPHVPTISIVACPSPTANTPVTVLFDQSLISSLNLRLGLPRLLLPASLPSNISVHRFLALTTWSKYLSLRRRTVVSKRSCGCTFAAVMHWSDVPSRLPSAIVDMLSSQSLTATYTLCIGWDFSVSAGE